MNTLTVTITSASQMENANDFIYYGGRLLANDARFDDVFYHHFLINNDLTGIKSFTAPNTLTIERTDLSDEHLATLEKMYEESKAIYEDNGWTVSWVKG